MRFVSAHKLTSYMMVACSFSALALSGELNPLVLLAVTVAIVGSWFWEEPRFPLKRLNTAWGALSLLVLAVTLLRAFVGGDFLLVGVEYLMFLMIAKLFNRSACRDYLHIYVLSFLMLVAGTVLNPEISYGLFFLGYVIATTWALILFHLRREMEENFLLKHSEHRESEPVQVTRILNSRRIVGRRFFIGTAALSLGVFATSSVLFLAIPRIGFGLFSQKRRAGISMSGFSDQVVLGGHGTLKSDNTVVMRVKTDRPYGTSDLPPLYWRGVAFDRYESGRWQRSPDAPRTKRQRRYAGPGKAQYHLLYDGPRVSEEVLKASLEQSVEQEIYLEPISQDVLFGASMPQAFEFATRPGVPNARLARTSNDEMRLSHGAGIKYTAFSNIAAPPAESLRAAGDRLPPGYRAYLQVPDEITQRVREQARDITKDADNNYDRAVAIERWLESELGYTLEMRSPGEQEPIDFFLFDRKLGHCEYFASAMTIMLRTLDIPARNVNGFLSGEWNEYDEYIAVRARDAHSWVEVYFDGVGWVTFDPTPASDEVATAQQDGVTDHVRRFIDTIRFQWFQWVIEYDLYRQMSLFRGVGDSVKSGSSALSEYWRAGRAFVSEHRYRFGGALSGGIMFIALVVLWRQRRHRERRGGQGPRVPMSALYDRVLTTLGRRGYGRRPAETPREHAARLVKDGVPGAALLCEFVDLYYAGLYGAEVPDGVLEDAQALAQAIRAALRQAPAGRPARPHAPDTPHAQTTTAAAKPEPSADASPPGPA